VIKKFLRKQFFKKKLSLLRGAKILRNQNTPFLVVNSISLFTKTSLNLDSSQFPKSLVGDHSSKAEILLRQVLLKKYTPICISIMQSIGSSKPLVSALPATWLNVLVQNGVACSHFLCKKKLLLSSFVQVGFGIYQFLYLAQIYLTSNNVNKPYVMFMGLSKECLPTQNARNQHNIISWYKNSEIKIHDVNEIWAEVRGNKNSRLSTDIFIQNNIFPGLLNMSDYLKYVFKIIIAFNVAIFGILRGRWWYGFLFAESIKLHYVKLLKRELLAEEYFFSNSQWFYKPLWAYEAERKGARVSLYYYSINVETFQNNKHVLSETYGVKSMTWNRFIVWDEAQSDYLKQYSPDAKYIIAGSIDFSDSTEILDLNNKNYNIAVFDVYAIRPTCYTGLGMAAVAYYSTKVLSDFLTDIGSIIEYGNIELLYKQKRVAKRVTVSPAAMKQKNTIIKKYYNYIDPDISAKYLINNSDAVISMPFTATAIIGKELGIPSIYYDASGVLEQTIHHGIPVLKNKDELYRWCVSLDIEKKAKIY
jgi:polysaccharide biosynthesis PFTS motif protein